MISNSSDSPRLSIVIPTRERAAYLGAAIKTCLANAGTSFEVIILDNASTDETEQVVAEIGDARLRYFKSSHRLSMRQNFERGLDHIRGEFVCFIGDDDGLLPTSIQEALKIFDERNVDAVACNRAHYAWPDLQSRRRNTALVPRKAGVHLRNSKDELKKVLADDNYYKLPCIYHGFVKNSLIQRIRGRDDGFFHSSQVDIYSSIALSMEDFTYAYSEAPLIINGGSSRSNGAAHFGGGSQVERSNWKKEDEIGFLDGFEGYATVGSLIIESALRYAKKRDFADIYEIFDREDVIQSLSRERACRLSLQRDDSNFDAAFSTAGISETEHANGQSPDSGAISRYIKLCSSFLSMLPIDARERGVVDVNGAAQMIQSLLLERKLGLLSDPIQQITAAGQIAFGRDN